MQTVLDDVVVRKHPPDTVRQALVEQLRLAHGSPHREVLVSPLTTEPAAAPDGTLVTLWPRLEPFTVAAGDGWATAGTLLARLHRLPAPARLPEHGGRRLLVRARQRAAHLRPGGTTDVLRILADELLAAWPAPDRVVLVHGDWHLGQLGRVPDTDTWLVGQPEASALDALGLGDPAWDLARPAALWSVGLLPDDAWRTLLAAYSAAGGPAPVTGRTWDALDHPARCLLFRLAVAELLRCGSDDPSPAADALVAGCVKLVKWR